MKGRTIALCVTGSIAAYKAVELARLLVTAGARVVPVMTASATRFVGPLTFAGICGEPIASDMWDASFAGEAHVAIARRAEAIAIVPATADVLARLAQGRADDLVTALVLCADCPILAAPAMHPRMWQHPATQRNVAEILSQKRIRLVGPVRGEVASGENGVGRMAEPPEIAGVLSTLLLPQELAGLRLIVTAGPTFEDLDPVRFIGNRSTGRMGFALARRAAERGANVTLISGPVDLPTPSGVHRIDVRAAIDMRAALWQALGPDLSGADALIMAAAVADHRPLERSPVKIKKSEERVSIELIRNPDLLAEVGMARTGPHPVLVGFALETAGGDALVRYARGKLDEKRVDLVVANEADESIGREDDRATLVTADGVESLRLLPKAELADVVLERVRRAWQGSGSGRPGGRR
jgi:phosphopantothenoylcysteine decarboxylase / phosphopantothenate---cysteine ligase